MRRQRGQGAVLDHLGSIGEEAGRSIVVVAVERGAPGAHDLGRRCRLVAAARGQRGDGEQDRREPHADSLPAVDLDLTPEQREIQSVARDFATAEIEPHAAEWDRHHGFPRELLGKLGELGLLGVCVPEAHGGAGADFLSYILVLEELSRADAGVGVTVAVHTSAGTLPILADGTPEQIERLVPPLAQGHELAAFALTEAGPGSYAEVTRTRATPDGDGWTISGSKQWITNGSSASTFLTFARTEPDV